MLAINQVSKFFGPHAVLQNIDLQLNLKETNVLIGSSGSGKSTLLRAILGLTPIDEGSIEFNNLNISHLEPTKRAALIGYVPQGAGLFPHLTAMENAVLVARAQGWEHHKIEQRCEELCSTLYIDRDLLQRFPSQLSGGQRQRIALLRAAFLGPELLLMDEPLGALDPLIRAELQSELREVFRRLGQTVVFVTHDIGEAAFLGDQIVLMNEGRVVQKGKIEDLQSKPASPFVTKFLNAQRGYDGGPR